MYNPTPPPYTLGDLFEDGRFAEAEEILASALEEEPDDPELHALRALCLGALDRDDEALAEADRAIAIDSRGSFGHLVRADLLLDRNRLDDALASARRAVELDPA